MSLTRAQVARTIDHTLLRTGAARLEIEGLVAEAAALEVWGVCVEGRWLEVVVPLAAPAGLRVVTVCDFPTGLGSGDDKAAEAAASVVAGADEIDVVVDPVAAASGDLASIERDIAAVRRAMDAAAAGRLLKVILETAALPLDRIGPAALAAEAGGADFVKTSTGFHPAGGATVEAVRLLADAVGGRLGIKASGGIRDAETALAMLGAGATRLGTSATRGVLDGLDPDGPG